MAPKKTVDWEVLKKLSDAGLTSAQIRGLDRGVNHSGFAARPLPVTPSTTAKQSSSSASPKYKSTAKDADFAGQYTARKAGDIANAAKRRINKPKVDPNYKSTAGDSSFAGTYVARKVGDAFSGKNPNTTKLSSVTKGFKGPPKSEKEARQRAAARYLEQNGSEAYKQAQKKAKKK